MIMMPEFIDDEMFAEAAGKSSRKLGDPPDTFRAERLHEGQCLQTMHVGAYDDGGPFLAELHDSIMPKAGLTFNGPDHEIYIGDPRRTEASRLKTILRQPVRPVEADA